MERNYWGRLCSDVDAKKLTELGEASSVPSADVHYIDFALFAA